ncbi:MAG: biopolymer transporter ExbD [Cytophagales bacterium]|nr:biopolymer transporter ExbD [Cytophagales bacterium]
MSKRGTRSVPEISSGSMADIAFLLLIFFLVTTTIANDRGIALLLPPKIEDEPPPEVTKKDKNIFKIQANSKDELLVEDEILEDLDELKEMVRKFILNFGDPTKEAVETYNSLPPSLKRYVNEHGRQDDNSDGPDEAVVSFKADRGTSYELYIRVLDDVNAAYNEIYAERIGLSVDEFLALSKRKEEEKELYESARVGLPRAISIAEPTKVGG